MKPAPRQSTLKAAAAISGQGLHTGEHCNLTLHPAEPGTGVVFSTPRGEIRAIVGNLSDTRRGTNLRSGDAEIHTVEHLLSALAGLGVDNVFIEADGIEVPICDGSALPFVELIESVGIEEQPVEANVIHLSEPVWATHADKYLLAMPANDLTIRAFIAFAHPMIGEQAVSFSIDPEVYKREIAPARTFCTSDEIEYILSQGLGRGGTEDNVIVAYNDHYSVPLRFKDELVRHKVLDLIGDLSLLGGRLCADITGIKTSHTLNTALACKIADRQL